MLGQKRIIVGKMGLDAHDNGLRIIAKWLVDIGYEVIYAGLYNTSERMVRMAVQEDADALGISFLGGEHLYYTNELMDRLNREGMAHIKVIVGGVIPPEDVVVLRRVGADAVFVSGTSRQTILDSIEELFN
jgi:methylmalonyl-CoA mutase C-terminal domain/subunit